MKARRTFQRSGKWYAQFETGNTFEDLFKTIPSKRFSFVHGECDSVGVGGFYLHGGGHASGLQEQYGSGNSTIVSMEVVTADGKVRTLSDDSDDQSLWKAMRKAGSSFGVATSLTIRIWERKEPPVWILKPSLPMTTSNILRWTEAVPSMKITIYPLQQVISGMSFESPLRTAVRLLRLVIEVKAKSLIPPFNPDFAYHGHYIGTNTMIPPSTNASVAIALSLAAARSLAEQTDCYLLVKPWRYNPSLTDNKEGVYLETTCWPSEPSCVKDVARLDGHLRSTQSAPFPLLQRPKSPCQKHGRVLGRGRRILTLDKANV